MVVVVLVVADLITPMMAIMVFCFSVVGSNEAKQKKRKEEEHTKAMKIAANIKITYLGMDGNLQLVFFCSSEFCQTNLFWKRGGVLGTS